MNFSAMSRLPLSPSLLLSLSALSALTVLPAETATLAPFVTEADKLRTFSLPLDVASGTGSRLGLSVRATRRITP